MSIDHLTKAFGLPPSVKGATRLVALALADAANRETDECWPSMPLLMRRSGIQQEKTIKNALTSLIEVGLLEITEQGALHSFARPDRRTNLYRLCGDLAVARKEPSRGRLPRPDDGGVFHAETTSPRGGSSRRHGGVVRAGNGGVVTTPLTNSSEPLVEPDTSPRRGAEQDAVQRTARRLCDGWWEWRKAQGEVPVQPYVAVLKIVERALRQGVTVNDMTAALRDTPTVTFAALEFTLSKKRGKVGRADPNLSEGAARQIVADYERNGTGTPPAAGRALPSET
jgi:hypothetical protein